MLREDIFVPDFIINSFDETDVQISERRTPQNLTC